ncbi:hypothetical protein [Microvirga guangxiensis]|uniref:Uncharacterized protein n=1 Tax=Microvirga guangxiensis TaxID=549386 RepID=A0A1G5F1F2_9HYPH|nr:hypothetical protein [Microvirga guangxiensis]SCY32730.1 hypothetical protein SAMN02927923_01172 [Microvirga guangxiensis]
MVKRIGSKAWRVHVTNDGEIVVLGIRTETGKEYEVLFSVIDSTPILTDLLGDMVRTHKDKPPRTFSRDAGPNHSKSVPVQPLSTKIHRDGEGSVLALDFGGTVLKVRIDPAQLQQSLSELTT